jgi:hypothetical protein
MQNLKELEQFHQVYKKHKEKQKVTHDKLKTNNKLNNQNRKSLPIPYLSQIPLKIYRVVSI